MLDFSSFDPFTLIKIGLEIFLFLYVIFAFVIVTQVRTMNKLVTQPPIGGILEIIAWIHTLLAASLFLLSLAIL